MYWLGKTWISGSWPFWQICLIYHSNDQCIDFVVILKNICGGISPTTHSTFLAIRQLISYILQPSMHSGTSSHGREVEDTLGKCYKEL
jgi:hypothetical protein